MDNSMVMVKGLAQELLECFLVKSPSLKQLEIVVSFITDVIAENKFVMEPRLSKKETACLYWASQGKSAEETASLLCLSKATIETYRSRIKKKLKCRNMVQAVYEGMRLAAIPFGFRHVVTNHYI